MKILWLDINSSYSHSSVALPAIHAQVEDRSEWEWHVVRGTINDNPGVLAAAVAAHKPDVIAATFWLFTHKMQIEVLSRAVQLHEDTRIFCGGPEFLGNNEDFLRRNPFVTAVIRGEGETALPQLLNYVHDSSQWSFIDGLCWVDDGSGLYHDNGTARVNDFSSLRNPEESSFFCWDKPFVQLETSRGCFNTCAFCVSGGDKPVRYQSIAHVEARLENIHSHGIRDVRVLDRTFNHDTGRACSMLDLFARYEGRMRFHLEIHPSLISDPLKIKLASMPEGLLHLEAGMQSLDSRVLVESGRKGSLDSSLNGLGYLCSLENIRTHADLIAGLPGYSLEMLCSDIVRLIETGVDELQIESLKVLPGTQLRYSAQEKGLKYSPLPPYEILQTPDISPSELRTAMDISRMIDLYFNCQAWKKIISELICNDSGFIMKFTGYLKSIMLLDSPVSIERRGYVLYEYCRMHCPDKVSDVSVSWIQAGLSLNKEPAGNVVRLKHPDTLLKDDRIETDIVYGVPEPTHRYYLMSGKEKRVIFGYDSLVHRPVPVFMAYCRYLKE